MQTIIAYCKQHPYLNIIVFHAMESGRSVDVKVINPFYDPVKRAEELQKIQANLGAISNPRNRTLGSLSTKPRVSR